MNRLITAVVAALLCSPVYATTTWSKGTKTDPITYRTIETAIATCTTGTETAPTSAAWAVGTTYAAGDYVSYNGVPYQSKAAANTGHQPDTSSTWWVTVGIDLMDVDGFSVHLETASAMTAGGKALAVLWNPETSSWNPVSDGTLDLTVSAVTKQAFSGFSTSAGPTRIAYYLSGVGGANPVKIYIIGARSK